MRKKNERRRRKGHHDSIHKFAIQNITSFTKPVMPKLEIHLIHPLNQSPKTIDPTHV